MGQSLFFTKSKKAARPYHLDVPKLYSSKLFTPAPHSSSKLGRDRSEPTKLLGWSEFVRYLVRFDVVWLVLRGLSHGIQNFNLLWQLKIWPATRPARHTKSDLPILCEIRCRVGVGVGSQKPHTHTLEQNTCASGECKKRKTRTHHSFSHSHNSKASGNQCCSHSNENATGERGTNGPQIWRVQIRPRVAEHADVDIGPVGHLQQGAGNYVQDDRQRVNRRIIVKQCKTAVGHLKMCKACVNNKFTKARKRWEFKTLSNFVLLAEGPAPRRTLWR